MSLPPPTAAAGLTVLFVDNHLLVVDKPAGLLTQSAEPGDDNLLDRGRAWVKGEFDKPGQVFLGLVHRLDRNVSGVVLFARTSKAASRLSDAFRTRAIDKTYLAVVAGVAPRFGALEHPLLEQDRGVVVDPRGKVARLTFRRLAATGGASLLEITLLTGRKHQIRAQLAVAGHPLVGDPRYGGRSPLIARPALHASRLAFEHPVRREPLTFAAPLPADLAALIADLGLRWPGV
ncbi:MAG: RNA pseudouridine synthase [Deltaproteobacteria bacterium HGW-Deltaproteobacteria-14]|jgi:23S rRNA pseudouridine1911/1915/1917 synthase|nr:MAG: RNA pseudouridine synthase [Deltaproteobacteria bacterium HGW-Deltaproteobacteria-14]